jgi:citrate lyase subunit gamma (acyl carrier protein)
MIEPGDGKIELIIQSSVINQYGKQIKATLMEVLNRLEITNARVNVVDKGALDCTLKARLECAVFRSCEITENYPWGDVIK